MAVRIRLKKMGRKARPFFRVCAVDSRTPRDGKVIEELGYYDPMVRDTDARAILKKERIDYWMGVGAIPSQKAGILIAKYGTGGTHVEKQQAALASMKARRPQRMAAPVAPGAQSSGEAGQESSESASGSDEQAAAAGAASE